MTCSVNRNNKGDITSVFNQDGSPSRAFQFIYSNPFTGGTDNAYEVVKRLQTEDIKSKFEGVVDKLYVHDNGEPKLYLKNSKGDLFKTLGESIASGTISVGEIGVIDPTTNNFIKLLSFDTKASSISEGIMSGIENGLISSERTITPDGELRFKGTGVHTHDIKSTARYFKGDFEESTGILVKVYNDGTLTIDEPNNFITVRKTNGDLVVMSKEEALEYVNNNNNVLNKAQIIASNSVDLLSTFTSKSKDSVSGVSDKAYLKMLNSFLNSLGFSVTTMNNYKESYKNRHGSDVDVAALVDLAERIVAVGEGQNTVELVTEELAHIAVESYSDSNSIASALSDIHLTPEYKKWATEYREKYSSQYSDKLLLEEAVRKEILGKVLARNVQENMFESSSVNTLWNSFVNFLKNIFRPSHRKAIDKISKDISDALKTGETSKFSKSVDTKAVFYNLKEVNDKITKDIENTSRLLSSLADLSEKHGSRGIRPSSLKNLPKTLSEAQLLTRAKDITDTIELNLKDLLIKRDNRDLTFVDYLRADTFKQIVDNNLRDIQTHIGREVNSKELLEARKSIEEKISTIIDATGKLSNDMKNSYGELFKEMSEHMINAHNISEEEADKVMQSLEGDMKDISKINSTWGLTSESSNPLLSMMAKLMSDVKIETMNNSQEVVNDIIELSLKNNWGAGVQEAILEKDSSGKTTGFLITMLDQGVYNKLKKEEEVKIISELTGLKPSEVESRLNRGSVNSVLDSSENIRVFNNRMELWHNENSDEQYLEDYRNDYKEIRELAGVDEEVAEAMMDNKKTVYNIRKDAKYLNDKGILDVQLMSENDRFIYESELAKIKERNSPLDQNLQPKFGLKLVRVGDLTETEKESLPYYNSNMRSELENVVLSNPNRVIVISEIPKNELPFESRYALDNANQNIVIEVRNRNNPTSNTSTNMTNELKALEEKGDFFLAYELAMSNGAVSYTDKYYDELSSGESLMDKINTGIETIDNENDVDTLKMLSTEYKSQIAIKSQFEKSYRSSNNVTELNAQNMSDNEKKAYQRIENELSKLSQNIKRILKKNGIEVDTNRIFDFKTEGNSAFIGELDRNGIDPSDKTKITNFSLDLMSEDKATDTRKFLMYVDQIHKLGKAVVKDSKFERFINESIEDNDIQRIQADSNLTLEEKSKATAEILGHLYAIRNLPGYYKRSVPNNWNNTVQSIISGEVLLSEHIENGTPISEYLTITPNFLWSDTSTDKGLNPAHKKAFGGKQPKLSKFKNQKFIDMFGISEEQWLAVDDITELTATKNINTFEYYKTMLALRKKSDELYGYKGNIYNAIQKSTTALQKAKQSVRSGGIKSGVKDAFADIYMERVDDLTYGEELGGVLSGVEAVRVPPTYFRKDIEDPNSITRDTLEAFLLDYVKATEHRVRLDMSPKFHALLNKGKNTEFYANNGIKANRRAPIAGVMSNTVKLLQSQMEYGLYGVKQSSRYEFQVGNKVVDMTRIIDKFRRWSIFTNLGFNPFVAGTSLVTGVVNNAVDTLTGDIYSKDSQSKSRKVITQDSAKYIAEDGKMNPKSRMNIFMELFGVKDVQERFRESSSSRLMRFATELGFKMDEYANLSVVPPVLYSTIYDHRVIQGEDGVYRLYSYDAYKVYAKTLGLKTKSEINTKWKSLTPFFDLIDIKDGKGSPSEEYLKMFEESDFKEHVKLIGAKASQQIQRVDGMITDMDRLPAQRDVFLNLIMQHKSWLPVSLAKQYKKEGFNFVKGRYEEGYMRTGFNFALELLSNIKNPKEFVNEWMNTAPEYKKKNLKRAGVYMGVIYPLLIAIAYAFVGADDDDDSFLEDYSRIIAYRTLGEVKNDTILGAYNTLVDAVESPFTALKTLQDQVKVLGEVVNITNEKYSEDLYKETMKASLFKRITQINDLGGYTSTWLEFNKESTGIVTEFYKNK